MPGISFSVRGISMSQLATKHNWSTSKKNIGKLFDKALQAGYKRSYKLCPVDTGWMLGQLFAKKIGDKTLTIGCDCDYAEPNEFGWHRIPKIGSVQHPKFYKGGYRPFIRPGIWRMAQVLKTHAHILFEEN